MKLVSVGILALFGALSVTPASAQMCGRGQQAQASTPSSGGGMMCGGMGAQADDPMADKPAQKPQASSMCPCCKNMAMMHGGSQGGMMHQNMLGMDTPKQ
jgi:hypothetical protein